jgi:hypothetical protein
MKRCYSCRRKKFLFLFKKDNSKYQLKSSLGRCIVCRTCNIKRAFKNGGYLKRTGKNFEFIKTSKIKIIKYFLG